jgi:hypothetical protein
MLDGHTCKLGQGCEELLLLQLMVVPSAMMRGQRQRTERQNSSGKIKLLFDSNFYWSLSNFYLIFAYLSQNRGNTSPRGCFSVQITRSNIVHVTCCPSLPWRDRESSDGQEVKVDYQYRV